MDGGPFDECTHMHASRTNGALRACEHVSQTPRARALQERGLHWRVCSFIMCAHSSCRPLLLRLICSGCVQTGKQLEEKQVHTDSIGDLQMSNDSSHFVTASKDKTAKLVDAVSLEVMKTYATEYPVNTATLSPIEDHVLPTSTSPLQALTCCIAACCSGTGCCAASAQCMT